MSLPPLNENGDLPINVHPAPLQEVVARFGVGSAQRTTLARRLDRIYHVAMASGHLARFIVFGSFITGKPEPNDVDVFLLMQDSFDGSVLAGDAQLLFDHGAAQDHFGASVFWLRRLAALPDEQTTIEDWPWHCRDYRGGAMIANDQELDATLERIRRFQAQVAHLRKVETNPVNFRLSASGFLAEIDRMQLEVREYLSSHPTELATSAKG